MVCPHCSTAAPEGAAECASCGVVFAKWERRCAAAAVVPAPAAAVAPAPPAGGLSADLAVPAGVAALFALYQAARFSSYLPINEGWSRVETWIMPLSALTVVIHEAGHAILGVLGWRLLTVAGGTLFQLGFPAAVIAHFALRGERAGTLFGVFWLGESLNSAAYYCADAKMQVLILITGMSGSEGGGHDWHYMLGQLGLTNQCVGLGRLLFFCGCFAMALPLCVGVQALWRRVWDAVPGNLAQR